MVRVAAILLTTVGWALPAQAAWLTVKNDTKQTVILESVCDAVIVKRIKTVRLLPGETYREFRLIPGDRKVQLYDGTPADKSLGQALGQGTLTWKLNDVTMLIESKTADGKTEWTVSEPPVKPVDAVRKP